MIMTKSQIYLCVKFLQFDLTLCQKRTQFKDIKIFGKFQVN